jgi:hypothetical protein
MTVQTTRKVDIDEVQQTLAEALGPSYRVTVTSDSTLKVGRTGVIPAKVQMRTVDGTTTFRVRTTGLILSRMVQACWINPHVRRALQRSASSPSD